MKLREKNFLMHFSKASKPIYTSFRFVLDKSSEPSIQRFEGLTLTILRRKKSRNTAILNTQYFYSDLLF